MPADAELARGYIVELTIALLDTPVGTIFRSSAKVCLDDAHYLYAVGRFAAAEDRAQKGISYLPAQVA